MRIIETIKSWFRKGGYALTGRTLKTLNDHPKINIDPKELERINRNFKHYKGEYNKVKYVNSMKEKQERDYMHLNLTKTTAKYLSGLVFNEQCEVVISDESKENQKNNFESANDFIQHVFEHNDFKKNLMRYLEPMFAIGGIAVRPYVDMTTGELEFSWALADAFYPLKSNSRGISEGVMMSVTTKVDGDEITYYTLLEFHEWENNNTYKITNELYKSHENGVIGIQVPLSDLYEDLAEEAYITDTLTRPLFNYLSPSGFNNINPLSPLGLGLTDNCKPTLKKLNDTYDGFYWEIKMGQRTVFVDDSVLQTLPSENGVMPEQVFDPDVNVYKSLRMNNPEKPIHDVTNDIRTEQYIAAINTGLRELEMQLELSVGTFSYDGRSMKTATEISSENSDTYKTRNTHVNEVEKFIKGLIVSTLELAKSTIYNEKPLFDGEIPTFEHIGVNFDDGIFVDKMQELKYYGQATGLGLMPRKIAIERMNRIPEDVAKEWEKQILDDQIETDPMYMQNLRYEEQYGKEE